ncbi:MAG: hypothetical protein WBE26_16175, partial [Phycisphaerae bacterium]
MILFCLAPAMGGVCPGAVAIPVGVDASAPAGLRFLNVVADLNGNGVFGDIVPLVEHLVQDIAVQVKPGAFAWVVVVGYPIRVGPVWVRATLTRNPIGVQNWNGANIGGVPFAFGETEDVLSLTPLFPPPPLAKKKCLGDKMPKLVRVRPNYIRAPRSFQVDVCVDKGNCCTRVDIVNCVPAPGPPTGPNIVRDPTDVLGFFCKLPRGVLARSPPGPGVFLGAGYASSASKPAFKCFGFPQSYGFYAYYSPPFDARIWRCQAVLVFDPDGLPVLFYDTTEEAPGRHRNDVYITEDCGDEVVGAEEDCDPPGDQGECGPGYVCNATCSGCAPVVTDVCGNGIIETGEVCDPPAEEGGCTSGGVCNSTCSNCTPCGNGVVDAGEVCDPPGQVAQCASGYACSEDCTQCVVVELCGNGQIDAGEHCDPPGSTGDCPAEELCNLSCTACEPAGACCVSDGSCVESTFAECEEAQSVYYGNGTSCEPNPCKGACCEVTSGSCYHEFPQDCEAAGNAFKGVGTPCGFCVNPEDLGKHCDDDTDCSDVVDACQDQTCSISLKPCWSEDVPPVYQCTITGETCVDLAPACITQACCNLDSTEAECGEAVGKGNTCLDEFGWSNEGSRGFATDCDPNGCEQTGPSGGATTCNDTEVHAIYVPPLGSGTVTLTLTGNNSTATFDDFPAWCDLDIFDPEGWAKDPGWWEGFAIDACANVRIDLCCSAPTVQPAWGYLFTGCPCADVLEPNAVDPPIGAGKDAAGLAYGEPFCDEYNMWQTYGPLPPGTYYYPIYSGPGGTLGVPPGGEYRLHITVGACPTAACCQLGCTGDTSVICQVDDDCTAVGGTCEPQCLELNEPDCKARVGWWGGWEDPPDPICDHPGECDTGACCLEPYECMDEMPGAEPMTKTGCDSLSGIYVGGVLCDNPVFSCPICPIEYPDQCLPNDHEFGVYTDLDASKDIRRVDDFVANSPEISQVCVYGGWVYADSPDWQRTDCACVGDTQENGCTPQVQDNFTVTIRDDNAGLPGDVVGSSSAWMCRAIEEANAFYDTWVISLKLSTPITGLNVGEVHWLEVGNDTSLPEGNGCAWVWMANHEGGNDWHVVDYNEQWEASDAQGYDMAFCIDQTLTNPDAPTGRCCLCDPLGDCVDAVTLHDCEGAPFESGDLGGRWDWGVGCADPPPCPDTRPPGDVCLDDMLTALDGINAFSNECADTDGPNPVQCPSRWKTFGKDIWYAYTATCTGLMTVSQCEGANYNGIMAIYTNDTGTCQCPTDATTQYGLCADDACGINGGPATITVEVEKGKCYTIRMAGWAEDDRPDKADQTAGTFTITCGYECTMAVPPTPDAVVTDVGNGTRNRYLSLSHVGSRARNVALRVKFVSLPIPHNYADGRTMWVKQPEPRSE